MILLRSAVTIQKEVDPSAATCPLMAMHRKICLDAARDMINHIHRSFQIAPGLRRWSYYCFYCLQAILVLLPQTDGDKAANDLLCTRAVEVFEQIKLKASQRCAEVVRHYLRRRAKSRTKRPKPDNAASHVFVTDEDLQAPVSTNPASVQQQAEPTEPMSGQGQDFGNSVIATNDNGHNTASVFSLDDSISWPPISPNALQTEMYGALYNIDPIDDFYLGHQPYFFGTEGLSNHVLNTDTSDWSQLWNN